MKISKKEISYFLKTNVVFMILLVGAVLNDIILRALTVKKIFYWKPVVTSVGMILLVSIFVWFLSYRKRNNVFLGLSVTFSLLNSFNYMYYKYYSSFLSFSLLKQLKNVGEVGSSVIKNLDFKVLIFFIPTIIMIIVMKNLKKNKLFQHIANIKVKGAFVRPFIISAVLLLFVFTTLSNSDKSRVVKQWNRPYLVEQLGIYSFTTADIVKNLSSGNVSKMDPEEAMNLVDELVETNNNAKVTNNYTDIFKGKDLYVIHHESAENFAMDLEFEDGPITPFLNKLAGEGLFFENFYPQHSVGTSSDTEFTFNTSLLPINNGTVFMTHADREYVSIQKLLKDEGYYTTSMHGNNGDFWNRNIMHETLGYDRFYSKDDYIIDEEVGLGLSDMSFFRQSVAKLKEIKQTTDGPVMATLINLSNHYPFDDLETYGEFNVGHLEGTDIGNYLKSYNYADMALESFVQEMDREGLLDNAVLLIYGDHHAKISKSDYEKLYNYDEETGMYLTPEDENFQPVNNVFQKELHRTPFVIWTKDQLVNETKTIPMGMIDAMPTLENMFGIYNQFHLGKDIMNLETNRVIFPDSDWIDENYFYCSDTSDLYNLESQELVEGEYEIENEQYISDKIDLSNNIIQSDLIRLYKESLNPITNPVIDQNIEGNPVLLE